MIYVTIPEGWVFIPARAILKDRALSTSTPDEPRSASVGISDRAGTGECPEIPDHPIESIEQDALFNRATNEYLPLQTIIKDALKSNTGRQSSITIQDTDTKDIPITLYFRKPGSTDKQLLQYQPNRNGKLPSQEPVAIIETYSIITSYPVGDTGTLWHKKTPLPPVRRQKVEEKAIEQKKDRRHDGDSPKPT